MEGVLGQILKEATSNKHAALREAVSQAQAAYSQESEASTHSQREVCIEPFKLCLESKTSKIIPLGITGLQKVVTYEKLKCREGEIEHEDDTMPNQILRAVAITPSLSEDHQVEIMKLLLMVACSNPSHVSPQTVINIAKFCQSVYVQSKPEVTKACQVTILQVMTDVAQSTNRQACIDWPSVATRHPNPASNAAKITLTQTLRMLCESQVKNTIMLDKGEMAPVDGKDRLCGDVVAVLGFLCNKVSETHKAGASTQNQTQLTFELEAILAMLSNMEPGLRGSSAFQKVLWQELCPTLIAVLGIPKDQKSIISSSSSSSSSSNHHPGDHHHHPPGHLATNHHQEHGRGSSSAVSVPVSFRSARHVIYCIAGELIRLVGCVASMRPVIGSLLHRMLLFPPPSQRNEALKVLKEILSAPGRILDLAGPAIEGAEITSMSNKDHKADLDLIKLLMDGISEASGCHEVCLSSIGCVGALLASLEQISHGKGMGQWQAEEIVRRAKEKEEENKKEMEQELDGLPCLAPENLHTSFPPERKKTLLELAGAYRSVTGDEDRPDEGVDRIGLPNGDGEREEDGDLQEVDPITPRGGGGGDGDGLIEGVKEEELEEEEDKVVDEEDPVALAAAAFAADDDDTQEDVVEDATTDAVQDEARVEAEGRDEKEKEEETREVTGRGDEEDNEEPGEELREDSPLISQDTDLKSSGQCPEADAQTSENEKKEGEKTEGEKKEGEKEGAPKGSSLPGSPSAAAEKAALLNAKKEKEAAQDFADALLSMLPRFLVIEDVMDVDKAIQLFASRYVMGYTMKKTDSEDDKSNKLNLTPVINADGIYVATYACLLLNLKLVRSDHYQNPASLPLTQKQFTDSVHYSGVLVYLSATWLGELYRIIITRNLLEEGGYQPSMEHCNRALISILTDLDGLGSQELGGQMLHDAPEYNQGIGTLLVNNSNLEGSAGEVFARELLTTFWRRILSILSIPLSSKHTQVGGLAFLLGSEGSSSKEQNSRDRDAICLSLDGLRKAAELSCTLGLQTRCAAVFAQLSEASCASDNPTPDTHPAETSSRMASLRGKLGKGQGMRLHAAHVLSMDALLSMGLEMGSHSAECWSHVFRCCAFVSQLEHTQFSSTEAQPSVTPMPNVKESTRPMEPMEEAMADELDLIPPYMSGHVPVAPPPAAQAPPPSSSGIVVQEFIKKEMEELGFEIGSAKGGLLSVAKAAKVVCGLSAGVDRLFDDAASSLNLQALLGFLRELRLASQAQLYRCSQSSSSAKGIGPMGEDAAGHTLADDHSMITPTSPSKSLPTVGRAETSLLLFRLGDVILKCVRHPSRPVIHMMKAWSVVAPHLIEAACHKDRHVSKRAIDIIHDVLTEVMMSSQELPHFNFHEALLKPFESLLRLELCDSDVQDQVVSSICELVEGSFSNIKSGWRPLFGALRAVRMQPHQHHESDDSPDRAEHPLAPVCNVFEAFLNTDNVTVFANAAIDCILCLLKFVRGGNNAGISETSSEAEEGDGSGSQAKPSSPQQRPPMTYGVFDLCFPALNYLHRCHKILASIHQMPSCPMFRGAHSIRLVARESFPAGELSPQRSFPLPSSPTSPRNGGLSSLGVDDALFQPIAMESVDDYTGIIRVWFLLLEGLTGAVALCPRRYQPPTLELLFELLRAMAVNPGPMFGVYAVTELLLPMMHSWVRRNRHVHSTWDATTANFKQACGLATDLVVEHLTQEDTQGNSPSATQGNPQSAGSTDGAEDIPPLPPVNGRCLMLKQMLDILVECIGQSNESVARLGCSCIRHLLLSAGPSFTHDMWTVACNGMQRAVATSLRSIRQLMSCFQPGSDDFMGDVCPVKVAARKDVTDMEYLRLQQLAQQVFQLDSQRPVSMEMTPQDDPRSFIFIIYPPDTDLTTNIDQIKSRVSFRGIVLGLLAHQLLVQTLGTILLHGSEIQVSGEHTAISTTSLPSKLSPHDGADGPTSPTTNSSKVPPFDSSLPGLLAYLSPRNLSLLLECFVQSYQIACEFNSRPGLKFLLQKVARFEVAANLYWQGAMSFTFYLHTLLELCHHTPRNKMEAAHIKGIVRALCRHEGSPEQVTKFGEGDIGPAEETTPSTASHNGDDSRQRSGTLKSRDSVSSVDNLHLKCDLTFHPSSVGDLDWLIKRLHGICNDVCASFIQLHVTPNCGTNEAPLSSDMALFFLVAPTTSPKESRDRMFTFELEDDPLSEGDMDDDEDDDKDDDKEREANGETKQSRQHRSSLPRAKGFKFASHWTPNVKYGSEVNGDVREHEVNVIEQRKKMLRQGSSGEEEGQIYTVATKKAIKSLMQEYKKRKLHHSRSVFVKKPTFKEQMYGRIKAKEAAAKLTPVERQRRKQIQEEQKSSILQDGEAQMQTWGNMLGTMLKLLQLLPDEQFSAFLPAIFPCINQLVCHVTNDQVRQGVMEFMDRVARIHGIV